MEKSSGLGWVQELESGLRWRVFFPDKEHAAATSYLRELSASDCADSTLRTYSYDLLRWFRFAHNRLFAWETAERSDVREFVEFLRAAPNPQRLRRKPGSSEPGSVNPITHK